MADKNIARNEMIILEVGSAVPMLANEIIEPSIEIKENGIGTACIIYKIVTKTLFFISSPPWVYYNIKAVQEQYLFIIHYYFPKSRSNILSEK